MSKIFKNKVVVITGGSEGIGKALVQAFLGLEARVATCGRNFDKLYQLQAQNSGKPLLIHTADVSNEQDCKNFIETVIHNFETIDIIINNAGVSMKAIFEETDVAVLKKIMDINFWGTVYCTKLALPYILKNKGSIVAISSIAGYRGLPGRTGYSASKFAMNGFMEALRTELLDSGTNVLWVCPGFTRSNIRNTALNALGKAQRETELKEEEMMSAAVCADHIINAITQRKRNLILTLTGKQTVWLNKLFPKLADRLTRNYFYLHGHLIK